MEFGGRQATTGLDVARAVASLGVDRGVIGFVRHVFVERNGLATFAVPIGVQAVEAVDFLAVLAQLDRWAAPLRRAISAPASLSEGLRELDNAQFAAATDNSVAARQRVLVAAARIDRLAQRSAGLRELGRKTRLSARDWIPALDDGSAELALAVSLASLRGQSKDRRSWLADLVAGDGPRAGRLAAIDHRPVVQTIAELATALAVSLPTPVRSSEAVSIDSGPQDGAQAVPVGQAVLCRFATGAVDERRLRTLLGALCLLDWSGYWNPANVGQPDEPGFIPPAVAVLGPLFARRPWTNAYLGHRAVASPTWPRRIAAGQIEQVCEEALRLYRIAGLEPLLANASGIAKREDGPRILAAVTIPLTDRAVAGLLDRTVRRPASPPATAPAPPSAAPSDLSPVQLEKPE